MNPVLKDPLVVDAIDLMRYHEPESGYYGCFSGGKDSMALKYLTRRTVHIGGGWRIRETSRDQKGNG